MFKGLETSKRLLKLVDEYVSSSDEEEKKAGLASSADQPALEYLEESKAASLTQLPEDYDLIEEVRDEEDCARLLQEVQDHENTRDDEPSITSEALDDTLAEQKRLQKLLERQQRILKASKLMPDLAVPGRIQSEKNVGSDALIEDVLNLNVFKQFLINQEHLALEKHMAHMRAEDSIMESDYLAIWQTFIRYQLFSKLKHEDVGAKTAETQSKAFHGQRGVFRFDPIELKLRSSKLDNLKKSVPTLDFRELNEMDIVVLAQQPIVTTEESEQLTGEETHQRLIQAITKTNPNIGNIVLAKVEFDALKQPEFKISPLVLQALSSYEVMTGGALKFQCYYLGDIQKACHLSECLYDAFLNVQLPTNVLQCQQNILTQVMKPALQKRQVLARRPNALDRAQGSMELYINSTEKLINCQTRVLRAISIMQASDLFLFGGEAGMGKTLTLLSAMTMVSKVSGTLKAVYLSPTAKSLSHTLRQLQTPAAKTCLSNFESLYTNLLVVSSCPPTEKALRNLTLEQRALQRFMEEQRRMEREQGHEGSSVLSLIERGRATEQLITMVVKRRNRAMFDENNSEAENMKLLQVLERVFSSEQEVTAFLDLPSELYCQSLSQHLQALKSELAHLPDFEQLKTEIMPWIVKDLLKTSRVIFCPLDEIPAAMDLGTVDFLFVDDAHMLSEVELFQALRLYPKRVVMAGNFISTGQQDKVANGPYLRSLMKDSYYSMFTRLAYSEQALVTQLTSQHRIGGVLKKLNEQVFQVPFGREGTLSFRKQPFHVEVVGKLVSKLCFFDLAYLREIGRGDERSRWRDNEEIYFTVGLLRHLNVAIFKYLKSTMPAIEMTKKGLICSFHENTILSKCTIGIVIPFPSLLEKYQAVIKERLLHKFNLSNVQVGVPQDFQGTEKDIMIVSSFRNSVDESLGCFSRIESTGTASEVTLHLQMLRTVLSRSTKFLWFIGSLDTLESTGDRTLNNFSKFMRAANSTYRRFEDQNEWKKQRLSNLLFMQSAISKSQQGGRDSQRDSSAQNFGSSHSARFFEEKKNANERRNGPGGGGHLPQNSMRQSYRPKPQMTYKQSILGMGRGRGRGRGRGQSGAQGGFGYGFKRTFNQFGGGGGRGQGSFGNHFEAQKRPNRQSNQGRFEMVEEQARAHNLRQAWTSMSQGVQNLNKLHKPPEEDKW